MSAAVSNGPAFAGAHPLSEAQSHLREGDVLVVWTLDRLGRSVKGLVDLVSELAEQGVRFRSVTDGIDTTTSHGRFFFHMMASLAQMERARIAERTKAGLDAGRKRGRMVGRKRRMTPGKVASAQQLLGAGMPPRDVAKNLGVSIPTLYRWIPASSRSSDYGFVLSLRQVRQALGAMSPEINLRLLIRIALP